MEIVITDGATVSNGEISFKVFEQFGSVTVYDLTEPGKMAERIQNADMVLCNKTPIDAQMMQSAKRLKYIGLFSTGFNIIDLEYARKRGITVCNVPGYSTEAVAQHTFSLMLALVGSTYKYVRHVADGNWVKSPTFSCFPFPLHELQGMTLGIVGYGSIGRRVADIALAFNMKVAVYTRRAVSDERVSAVSFEELLKSSDIVSLHCPLNAESADLMDERAFSSMKKGAFFINTARGGLVDEHALRQALDSKRLAGAGLDVLRTEPMSAQCPLLGCENCIITPHIAWAGEETRTRLLSQVVANIKAFLEGKPVNTVC